MHYVIRKSVLFDNLIHFLSKWQNSLLFKWPFSSIAALSLAFYLMVFNGL